jgi:hypothetical protein
VDEKDQEPASHEVGDQDKGTILDSEANLEAAGDISAPLGGITIITHLWIIWMEIAIDQTRVARGVRAEMERLYRAGDSATASDLLSQEFRASLVAVTASAHALDALYGSTVIPLQFQKLAQNRRGNIREAFKRVFDTGKVNTAWVKNSNGCLSCVMLLLMRRSRPRLQSRIQWSARPVTLMLSTQLRRPSGRQTSLFRYSGGA